MKVPSLGVRLALEDNRRLFESCGFAETTLHRHGERDPPAAAVADDDVIVKPDVQEPCGVGQLARRPHVLPQWRRIAGRMVVHQEQRGRPFPKGEAKDLTRMDERRGLRAARDQRVHQVVVLGVEQHGEEVPFVVVVVPQEIERQQRGGLG